MYMNMIGKLTLKEKNTILEIWKNINSAKSPLNDFVFHKPSEIIIKKYSREELEYALGFIRVEGGITDIETRIIESGFGTGYTFYIKNPRFWKFEDELSSEPDTKENKYNTLLSLIPNSKSQKVIKKIAKILFYNLEDNNYQLVKCINPKLSKNEFSYKQYKWLIRNRFKTLNKYLEKINLHASLKQGGCRLINYSEK